jgi:hypothetical protein
MGELVVEVDEGPPEFEHRSFRFSTGPADLVGLSQGPLLLAYMLV